MVGQFGPCLDCAFKSLFNFLICSQHFGYFQAERLKDGLTTVVGAVMQKQQCWEKTACTVGAYLHSATQAKDVVFILAEKVSPSR